MAGLHAVVVGYRYNDRRRHQLRNDVRQAGPCYDCGQPTFFVRSGQDAVRARDPIVMCDDCYQREKDHVQAEL